MLVYTVNKTNTLQKIIEGNVEISHDGHIKCESR